MTIEQPLSKLANWLDRRRGKERRLRDERIGRSEGNRGEDFCESQARRGSAGCQQEIVEVLCVPADMAQDGLLSGREGEG
jgi:hypothetical protein